jgi:hypothetical protein
MMVDEAIHPLAGAREYQDAIATLSIGQALTIDPDPKAPGAWLVYTDTGQCIGKLTARNPVSQALAVGNILLRASVNSVSEPNADKPYRTPRVRMVIGEEGESYLPPPPAGPRKYMLGLAGESHYQAAIARSEIGDVVGLLHTPDNPHDSRAVAAIVHNRGVIGHVPRDSWLTSAIIDERKIVVGTIAQIAGPPGRLGVVLEVTIDPFGVPTRQSSADVVLLPADGGNHNSFWIIAACSGGLLALLLLLVSCSSESAEAEAELAMIIKANGNGSDRCAARRKVAEAYLHERKQQEYQEAKVHADGECLGARLGVN